MVRLLHQSLDGGALGFSSSLGEGHTDGANRPVPSRAAEFSEFVALAGALRDHPGTTLEFIPTVGPIARERMELMADMSLAADRSLNWNLLGSLSGTEIYEDQLTASDVAAARGAHVVALTLPDLMRMRASTLLESLPGWREVVQLDATARRAAIADPATRARLREGAARGIDQVVGRVVGLEPHGDRAHRRRRRRALGRSEPSRSRGGARHRHRRRADRRRVAGSARVDGGAPVTHPDAREVRRGLGRPRRGVEGRTRRCSAAPTRARTSTSCATRTIRASCSARSCATVGSCRSRKPCR